MTSDAARPEARLAGLIARARARVAPYMPVLRVVGFVGSVALVVLVGVEAAEHVKTHNLTWWPLVVALPCAIVWWVGLARAWGLLASGAASRRDVSVWVRTQALRYLPGGFWAPASRTTVLEGGMIDRVGTVAAENIVALCAALGVGGVALALGGRWWGLLVATAIVLPVLLARQVHTRTRVVPQRARDATINDVTAFLFYAVAAALVQGAISGPHHLLLVAGAATIAWGVGLVVIIAPGGVGIREVTYVWLLHGVLPSGQLATGAVTSRVVLIAAELIVLLVAGRSSGKADATPSSLALRVAPVLGFARRHAVFLGLLAAGIAVRALTFAAYRPALVYWDSQSYLFKATHLTPDALRPLFYPLFLRALPYHHALWVIPLLQHLMGLVMAGLIYTVLVRLRVPRWGAALAAAPILLNSFQLVLEEYILTETLYDFLLVGAVSLLLWKRRPSAGLAALAGFLLALVTLTRANGEFDIVPFLLAVVVLRWQHQPRTGRRLRRWGRSLRPALAPLVAMVICFAVPVGAYAVWYHHANGPSSPYAITDYSGRFLYARVAPFADCTKFVVPAAERHLCPIDPVGHRPRVYGSSVEYYMWGRNNSPMWTLVATETEKRKLGGAFAKRVILHQPWAYAKTVIHDFLRGFTLTPNRADGELPIFRWQFQSYMPLFFGSETEYVAQFGESPHVRKGLARFLKHYRRYAYVPGVILSLGLIVGLLAGLGLVPGRSRRSGLQGASLLLSTVALVAFGTTVLGNQFTWRYQLPLTVFLPAAAAVGLTAMLRGVTRRKHVELPVVAPSLRPDHVPAGTPSGATG